MKHRIILVGEPVYKPAFSISFIDLLIEEKKEVIKSRHSRSQNHV